MNALAKDVVKESATEIKSSAKRYKAGVLKYAQMGYWQPDYVPKDTDIVCAVPHHAAGRRRSRRGGRGGRRRIVDRDLDGGLDRSPDRLRQLPRQGLQRRAGAATARASTSPGSPTT
jgi:hypothetical protein